MNRLFAVCLVGSLFFIFSGVSYAQEPNYSWNFVAYLSEGDMLPASPAMIDVSDTEVMLVGIGADAYFYNTTTHMWRKERRFHTYTAYANPTIVKLSDGKILVTGMMGYRDNMSVPAQIYNPDTNSWTETAQLDIPFRINHTTTLLNDGKVLLVGGYGGIPQGRYHLGEVDMYDPSSNIWSSSNRLHQPRSLHTATKLPDGNVLIAGGHGNTFLDNEIDFTRAYALKSVEKYSFSSGQWEIMSDMLQPRSAHTATLLPNGKILIIGGLLLDTPTVTKNVIATNSAELYDPDTDTWEYTGSMQEKRAYHTATVLPSGKVLITGGVNGEPSSLESIHSLSTAELYDPISGRWSQIGDMHAARGQHAAVLLSDGNVIVAGGINNSTPDPYVYRVVNTAEILKIREEEMVRDSVAPFLRLPFDYESRGKSFEQVAYNPSSWFDHAYPLQNIACCTKNVTKYNSSGMDARDYYRSHNGYDYALQNGVTLGTPVLAAAAGKAAFIPAAKSGGGGNVIKIDHGNGYQTWYEHLDNAGLIVSREGETVTVSSGQQIGKVGMTGNTTGPHIHFSVFTDENKNNSFADDYPFGLVDALGWEGRNGNGDMREDPWTLYSKNGRHGAKSSSLFLDKPSSKKMIIPTSRISTQIHKDITVSIPESVYPTFFSLDAQVSAFESDDTLKSAMPSFFLYAKDNVGNTIKNFFAPITILYKYAEADLSNIVEDSLKMYFFDEEKKKWEALPSSVDKANKQVTAQTTHFTYFALMGEVKDILPPTTSYTLDGQKGEENWYRSDISIMLESDDKNGSGVAYTFYSINNSEAQQYKDPIILSEEGDYMISYFSTDMSDNREVPKNLTLHIDKTMPEAVMRYDVKGRKYNVSPLLSKDKITVTDDKSDRIYLISDQAGNTLEIKGSFSEKDNRSQFAAKSLQYSDNPLIPLVQNAFITFAKEDKTNSISQINQRFNVRHEEKVVVDYLSIIDNTRIIRKETDTKKVREEKAGQHLLRLYTEKGALRYSF